MDSLNSKKPVLWVLNKFLRISEYAYGGVVDLLMGRKVSDPINIVLTGSDFKAAKDICRDVIAFYGNIFSTYDVTTVKTYNGYDSQFNGELRQGDFESTCLVFHLSDIRFNVFPNGSRLMDFLFAHNYVALKYSDDLPELFMLNQPKRSSGYSLIDVLKNPEKLSDLAENWCDSFSSFGWKDTNCSILKEKYEEYHNNFGKKRDEYEGLRNKYQLLDKLSFYHILAIRLAEQKVSLPVGKNCRFVKLGKLREIALLDKYLPDNQPDYHLNSKGEPWENYSDWSHACDQMAENRKKSITDKLQCPICRGLVPFQYQNDDTEAIIIGAEIFHIDCVEDVGSEDLHSAFLDVRTSLDNMSKEARKRYNAISDDVLAEIGIISRDLFDPDVSSVYKDAIDKFVFGNPILRNTNAKIFGGFVRRYMSADIGLEFDKLECAFQQENADIDIITDKEVYSEFAAVSVMSPSENFVIGRGTCSMDDEKNGFSVSVLHEKKPRYGEDRKSAKIKMDIHHVGNFTGPNRSKYVSDAFANILIMDIATGNISIMNNFEPDDLRMSSLTQLETFSLALETTINRIYMLKQAIPKRVIRMNVNHLRRIYKPLQMQMAGWKIDYSYVEWRVKCYETFSEEYSKKSYFSDSYDIETGPITTLSIFAGALSNGEQESDPESEQESDQESEQESMPGEATRSTFGASLDSTCFAEGKTCIFCKRQSMRLYYFDFEQVLDTLMKLDCGHSICLRCLYFGKDLHKLISEYDYYDVEYADCKQIIQDYERNKRQDYKDELCPEEHDKKCLIVPCYHSYGCVESKYVKLRLSSGN